jgi:hypothetical protein
LDAGLPVPAAGALVPALGAAGAGAGAAILVEAAGAAAGAEPWPLLPQALRASPTTAAERTTMYLFMLVHHQMCQKNVNA